MKSWNEIRKAATVFSKRWKGAYDEKSQAQSFLVEMKSCDKKFASDVERVAHLFGLYAAAVKRGCS